MIKLLSRIFLIMLLSSLPLHANPLDRWERNLSDLDRSLFFQSEGGSLKVNLHGLADYEYFNFDQNTPGLINTDRNELHNWRLSLFSDIKIGKNLFVHTLSRWSRGHYPSDGDGHLRLDSFFLTYPLGGKYFDVKIGEFGTSVGNWVPRRVSWPNPFITPPLLYDRAINLNVRSGAGSRAAFFARRDLIDPLFAWPSVIRGANYSRGIQLRGNVRGINWNAAFRSDAVSAPPDVWDDFEFDHPTWTARLSYQSSPRWEYGLSFSQGPYHTEDAIGSFPSGTDIDDFEQTLVGGDITFSHHQWQVWTEGYWSEFEVPNVESVWVGSYFLALRRQLFPRWFTALRWGQQFFEEIDNGAGQEIPWDRNTWRLTWSTGFRYSRHIQMKLQLSSNHQNGPNNQGAESLAIQFTNRF